MNRLTSYTLFLCAVFIGMKTTYTLAQPTSESQAALQSALSVERIEPRNWWIGMKTSSVQVLFYGRNIGRGDVRIYQPYPGVSITKTERVENPNYLFVTLSIAPTAKPGGILLQILSPEQRQTAAAPKRGVVSSGGMLVSFSLFSRTSSPGKRHQGCNAADVVYMLMPDRFCNGDTTNDVVAGMPDITHRDSAHARHGGDIAGIISKLSYIKQLGCTALWSTPLLENNQERYSYHGYGITDFYQIDRRFGSNELYKLYVDSAHSLGLKVIKDVVLNHCGDRHWMAQDPPTRDWFNDYDRSKQSSNWKEDIRKPHYRASVMSDMYAAQADRDGLNRRWFDWMLPDFNQQHPLLARYLIQNTLWWIEYAGLDGLRVDTYPYSDPAFLTQWSRAIVNEYPTLSIVGEVWIGESPAMTAYWLAGTKNRDGYTSFLPTATDFPLMEALSKAFNETNTWSDGIIRLYNTLASDFLYPNAASNLIFLDNHDTGRFFSTVGENMSKFKLALTFLLTTRGVPQLYYGTELATPGIKDIDPNVRKDFIGGWPNDNRNAFTEQGRTPREQEAFAFLSSLLAWRKRTSVIHTGKLMHFVPLNGVYVYFRYNEKSRETVAVLLNSTTVQQQIDLSAQSRFAERTAGFSRAVEALSGTAIQNLRAITLAPQSALILELNQ
jgi:glycosidase